MTWGDPSWYEGLIGGVIGGGATGLAVMWTLRHERQETRRAVVRELLLQTLDEGERLWAHAATIDQDPRPERREFLREATRLALQLDAHALKAEALAFRRWPGFASQVGTARTAFKDHVGSDVNNYRLYELMKTVRSQIDSWQQLVDGWFRDENRWEPMPRRVLRGSWRSRARSDRP